ncbi:predicted membrane metal-binding protein [Microbacterium testaceum StLB037]|uniref:Predicted membrane metal-binding protein n=1 Tax=Microbacterium testaceum (strain StLB037) TaxID=979556 RepID=E8NBF0_MICTS|nr:hypothetical protein [Microbacterium testaceum]BAJ76007.1 predicted membrane metal-binding protein [Microbacterium testaceum StLB037]
MSDIRVLTAVSVLSLVVWISAMLGAFVSAGPIRWLWLSLGIVAIGVNFASFWRARWIENGPARRRLQDRQ